MFGTVEAGWEGPLGDQLPRYLGTQVPRYLPSLVNSASRVGFSRGVRLAGHSKKVQKYGWNKP